MNTPYDLPPELQLFEPHLRTDRHDRGCCANRTGAAASHRGVLQTSHGLASRELGTRRIYFNDGSSVLRQIEYLRSVR